MKNIFSILKLKRNEVISENQETIFTEIYNNNSWHSSESLSGSGSELLQTQTIIKALPVLFKQFEIKSILDIPCGDFNWMKLVDLEGIDYIGADIVGDIILSNKDRFEKDGIHFEKLDLIENILPKVDLIFVRDCLVHLPFEKIEKVFENIKNSNSKYLLSTTFPKTKKNINIKMGDWRMLNLEKSPFNLPAPISLINENCTICNGDFSDKSLGLWKIEDI